MTVQPPADTVLINMETIVYTTAEEQIHTTDLAGIPLQIRATPTNFHWDFGDGTAFDTKKKGAPYPNHYLWHKYTEPTRDGPMRRITLTTTWTGSFSVDNGPWQTIDGTTTTTQTSHEFHVIELRSRIIENP